MVRTLNSNVPRRPKHKEDNQHGDIGGLGMFMDFILQGYAVSKTTTLKVISLLNY